MRFGYQVLSLERWVAGEWNEARPTIALRHDVDQHPASALRMARIEEELGIRSTWYFRWRTADDRVIAQLRERGHDVGLHYETLTRVLLRLGEDRPSDIESMIPWCREVLTREIDTFTRRHGPIVSVCPHGDSRVPGVSNAVLLKDEDCSVYGIRFDGNEAMRGRGIYRWLTDRSSPEGGWGDGADPEALFAERRSPLLLVVHPNNWSSGIGLWRDRATAALLPAEGSGGPIRTRRDAPPLGA